MKDGSLLLSAFAGACAALGFVLAYVAMVGAYVWGKPRKTFGHKDNIAEKKEAGE